MSDDDSSADNFSSGDEVEGLGRRSREEDMTFVPATQSGTHEHKGSKSSSLGSANIPKSKGTVKQSSKRKVVSQAPAVIGGWEKNTKGFGAKFLKKFGFTGRLGANEDGVSSAIEVKVRPSGLGLGFGGIVEASASLANKKLEAEWRGIDLKSEGAEETLGAQSWRKGSEHEGRRRLKKLSAVELLMAQELTNASKMEIIDMTLEGSNEEEVKAVEGITAMPELGQELLYNLNVLVEVESTAAKSVSKKLHLLLSRSKSMQEEVLSLDRKIMADEDRLDRLTRMNQVIVRVKEKLDLDVASVSIEAVCGVFATLLRSFPEEFSVFGTIHLLPIIARPVMQHRLSSWIPFKNPFILVDMLNAWKSLQESFSAEGKDQLGKQAMELVREVLESLILPTVRRALVNDWIFAEDCNSSCATLSQILKEVCNESNIAELVDNSILPRLTVEVNRWNPSSSNSSSFYHCISQWIPILSNKISILFPEIRRKISHALSSWDGVTSLAFDLVSPWKGTFDEGSFVNLLLRVVVPKLITSLRLFIINPQNQDIAPITSLLQWHTTLPSANLIALLVGEFFPKWLQVLFVWLSSPQVDLEEISEWYSGWRGLFPELLADEPLIKAQFNLALDMMEASMGDLPITPPYGQRSGQVANSYVAVMESINIEEKTNQRLAELKQGAALRATNVNVSFKEVIAAFAESHGIEFRPKEGKQIEGKQVWAFGGSLIYIDQNVVFVYQSIVKRWTPIGLEELVAFSKS